ncbi:hypothetical protein ACFXPR_16215 [Nocardia tengchongensis]|uniref:hypothetical protein n=1 Tax=Nocardia tengchongensis TaxID=2055889 RepID=UPI0036BDFC97
MLGIPIENHEAIGLMTLAHARDVLRVHTCCALLACPKKRQATALINQARIAARQELGLR